MTTENIRQKIQAEFATASLALTEGNDGKVRVCARRAAGLAITYWLSQHPGREWRADAVSQLRGVASDGTFPEAVRDAARRLTTRVTPQFTTPDLPDPLAVATIIINYFMENKSPSFD